MGCKGLSRALFDLMNWEDEGSHKFNGKFISDGKDKLLLFELAKPIVTKTVIQVIVPDEPDAEEGDETKEKEEIVPTETLRVYLPSWADPFGEPVASMAHVSVLDHKHYAEDWDVIRPATELEEMNIFTAENLAELMGEAETIMEGWTKQDE